MSGRIAAPEPLGPRHDLVLFCSGEPALDDWLRTRAARNEGKATRTYVACLHEKGGQVEQGTRVVGFYSLAVGSVAHEIAPGSIRRNMPDPVPVMILARLAVDQGMQGRGIGRALVRDALLRTAQAAGIAGIRAILVHALHERAATFYAGCGFHPSSVSPLTLLLRMEEVQQYLHPQRTG
ncbi:GNAT family N-acetyltransferase [Desulfovibrio oxamicus]|uniref:GNAT family N-acetyltransferase n=1 Tax=Nitratidesulfovibrio oxamicus TaxID=32016 RepID=A0ABS0J224_9BACT|nr:GNAT family N-acetyltransferase [Nitratidesulfovibrio oxamicus]MBG3876207.1 GNAT family N-acetyltransferase [Nitratidesulfovibrio oxamicus]